MKFLCSKQDADTIRDQLTRAEFAEASVGEAEVQVEKIFAERNKKALELNTRWDVLDPLDPDQLSDCAQLRLEIQNIDLWLTNPPPLRRAADIFARELAAARPVVQAFAQPRCVAEQVISRTFWSQILAGVEMSPLDAQIRTLRQVALEVKSALRTLLEAPRGIELNPDENRTGILQRGLGLGNRPLSFEERQAGVAFE